jgi:toxin ParE1/3/4
LSVRVAIAAAAERDLDGIVARVSEDSGAVAALRLEDRLLQRCATLASFPHRGNVPPELLETGERGWREIHEPPYRIVYRVAGDVVVVALIADARRDVRALLAERLLR